MEFGIQFFPDVGPDEKPADQYWREALDLVALCDEYGYTHVRTVEHYFHRYGGYSTNPVVFLAAASQRTQKARLITGAIIPVFNHPLKVAGEIGMLDAISGGRLEVGFARAFLPHEFRTWGRDLDESRARFDEGVAQITRLVEDENVTEKGRFHSFENVTSLPRPTQKPRPAFWLAAASTPESFTRTGELGHWLMTFPRSREQVREWIGLYRDAWRKAGHPGQGRVMIALHMYCASDGEAAVSVARDRVNAYLRSQADAASDWATGTVSKDYEAYPRNIEKLLKANFESAVANGGCWVGTPEALRAMIAEYDDSVGGFDVASLQVNFHTMPVDLAAASMRLFSREVMPYFAATAEAG